jgi:hypothetical protein
MNENIDLQSIESLIYSLTRQEQLYLIQRVSDKILEDQKNKQSIAAWKDLYGIGKGIWENTDPQEYVNKIRDDRF